MRARPPTAAECSRERARHATALLLLLLQSSPPTGEDGGDDEACGPQVESLLDAAAVAGPLHAHDGRFAAGVDCRDHGSQVGAVRGRVLHVHLQQKGRQGDV